MTSTRSTIADVALAAGVARSTVSAVLTGRKFVSPDLRSRVEAAIAELDFTANARARALATARTMVIGIVVQLRGPEFSPALAPWVFALSDAARVHGYEVLLISEADSVEAIGRVCRTHQVDGLILLSIVESDPRLAVVADHDIPAVMLGFPRDSRGIDLVDLDFASAARQVLEHLHERGHRRVLFAQRAEAMFNAQFSFVLRFDEALTGLSKDMGMQVRRFHCPSDPEVLPYALSDALVNRGGCTALLLHDDAAAVLLPMALSHAGLRCPADISVISLHSTELTRALALPYTSIESDTARVSQITAEVLFERLRGERGADAPSVHRLLRPHLTDRGSVREHAVYH